MGVSIETKLDLSKFIRRVRIDRISFDPDLFTGSAEITYTILLGDKPIKTKTLKLGYTIYQVPLTSDNLQKEAEEKAKEMNGYVLRINESSKIAEIGIGDFYDLAFSKCDKTLFECIKAKVKEILLKYISV